eukprot:4640535-Prymnesium_polylepis.1
MARLHSGAVGRPEEGEVALFHDSRHVAVEPRPHASRNAAHRVVVLVQPVAIELGNSGTALARHLGHHPHFRVDGIAKGGAGLHDGAKVVHRLIRAVRLGRRRQVLDDVLQNVRPERGDEIRWVTLPVLDLHEVVDDLTVISRHDIRQHLVVLVQLGDRLERRDGLRRRRTDWRRQRLATGRPRRWWHAGRACGVRRRLAWSPP